MYTRKLNADDWALYKEIRLEALRLHPDAFGTSLKEAEDYKDKDWQGFLSSSDSAFFGLFDGDEIVGSSGIFMEDASTKTGMLIGGYIRESHRGKGYSHLLYESRIQWAKQSGLYDRLIVGHRKGNEASRRTNQAFGFQYIGDIEHPFGDGNTYTHMQYELRIK